MCEPDRHAVHVEESDVKAEFLCDELELAEFFREQALAHERSGFGRTYVLRRDLDDPPEFPPVLGYYTICMARLVNSELPQTSFVGTTKPPPSLPAALLGRMARDKRVPKERQLGEFMMADAIRRILEVREKIGCALVMLDAMKPGLVKYYSDRFGFIPTKRQQLPQKMYLLLDTVVDLLEASP